MKLFSLLLQRLTQATVVLFVISIIAFSVQNQLGDPLHERLALAVSEQERTLLREQIGLNDPFLVQYQRFLIRALHGDFGTSYFFKQPVTDVIMSKMPATVELVLLAGLLTFLLSVPSGMFCAIKPKNPLSHVMMGLSTLGISIPVFLTAIGLIYIFSIELQWLPSFGRGETTLIHNWETGLLTQNGLLHLILPCLTLTSIMLPLFLRLVRSEMIEVLHKDYVQFAWAQGLSAWTVWFRFGLRNTLLPLITVGGIQLGTFLAFTLLTETIFQWPGLGFLFLEAIERVDTPLITAYILFAGLLFVITNFIVDLLYLLADPTVHFSAKGTTCTSEPYA